MRSATVTTDIVLPKNRVTVIDPRFEDTDNFVEESAWCCMTALIIHFNATQSRSSRRILTNSRTKRIRIRTECMHTLILWGKMAWFSGHEYEELEIQANRRST